MPDGRTLGAATWCDRCGQVLSHEPGTPAPPGYPAPDPRMLTIRWDAAALPDGQAIAMSAARLLARLSDIATEARWDAYHGPRDGRGRPYTDTDPDQDASAARILIRAARQLPPSSEQETRR